MRASALLVSLAIVMSACSGSANTAATAGEAPAPSPAKIRRQANLISEEELSQNNARTALMAVQQLRPEWIRGRGASSMGNASDRTVGPAPVLVYLNNQKLGGLQELEGFSVNQIKSLRFINASDATNRWGTGHGGGVIEITTK